MKLIEPYVEIIPQGEGLLGVYKQIEVAGRTCYKSEDKITDDSCIEFVQRMIDSGHTAMLEHGTIYLTIPISDWNINSHEFDFMFPENCPWVEINADNQNVYVTTNLRYMVEQLGGTSFLTKYISEPTEYHEKRVTVRFTCDRGVSHELVRHKKLCVA